MKTNDETRIVIQQFERNIPGCEDDEKGRIREQREDGRGRVCLWEMLHSRWNKVMLIDRRRWWIVAIERHFNGFGPCVIFF